MTRPGSCSTIISSGAWRNRTSPTRAACAMPSIARACDTVIGCIRIPSSPPATNLLRRSLRPTCWRAAYFPTEAHDETRGFDLRCRRDARRYRGNAPPGVQLCVHELRTEVGVDEAPVSRAAQDLGRQGTDQPLHRYAAGGIVRKGAVMPARARDPSRKDPAL